MLTLEEVREKVARNMPQRPACALTWERDDKYSQISTCKRYRVSAYGFGLDENAKQVWLFHAWLRNGDQRIILAARLPTKQEAEDVCEAHSKSEGIAA